MPCGSAIDFCPVDRIADAHATRADAARLYGEMLAADANQFGPQLAPVLIQALAAMGID
jgi:hypothetical protein